MELILAPGDKLKVTLKDADGEFTLEWGKTSLRVVSDLPDTNGRKGLIYEEVFKEPDRHEKDLLIKEDGLGYGIFHPRG